MGGCGCGKGGAAGQVMLRVTPAAPEWDAVIQASNLQMLSPGTSGPDDYVASGYRDAALLAHTAEHLVPWARSVLDFGAGDGRLTRGLLNDTAWTRIVAAEASPTGIRALARLERAPGRGLELVRTDGTDLADRLATPVDVTVALDVLPYMARRDAAKVLAGIAQVTQEGGIVVATIDVAEAGHDPTDWTDRATWTDADLVAIAADADLQLEAGWARSVSAPVVLRRLQAAA